MLGKLEAALGTMFLMVVSSLPILAMSVCLRRRDASDLILLVCCFCGGGVHGKGIGLCCSRCFADHGGY